MGALSGNKCHADQQQALDHYYGNSSPGVSAGPNSYIGVFERSESGWTYKRTTIDDAGNAVGIYRVAAPSVVFPECDVYESFKDGMMLGWGVTVAMIAAFCVVVMRRGL